MTDTMRFITPDFETIDKNTVFKELPLSGAASLAGGVPDETLDFSTQNTGQPPPKFTHIGRILGGKYRVGRLIGHGGMGCVFMGTHLSLDREIAIKVIRDDLIVHESVMRRFQQEAQLIAKINHDRIVQVYDFGVEPASEGRPQTTYLVMEHLTGESLLSVSDSMGPLAWRTALQLIKDTFSALKTAHQSGIIHRDLKPDNLMLLAPDGDGRRRIKVMDFGIARLLRGEESDARLTSPGVVIGTPGYMAPEVFQGLPSDHRADLYAMGVIWFRILMGKELFEGNNPQAILSKQIQEMDADIRPLLVAQGVPQNMADLIQRLLARNPQERPNSAREVEAALERFIQDARKQSENPTPSLPPSMKTETTPVQASGAQASAYASPLGTGSQLMQARLPNGEIVTGQFVPFNADGTPQTPGTAVSMVPMPVAAQKSPWAMAFGVLLLGVVGVGAFFYGNQNKEKMQQEEPKVVIREMPALEPIDSKAELEIKKTKTELAQLKAELLAAQTPKKRVRARNKKSAVRKAVSTIQKENKTQKSNAQKNKQSLNKQSLNKQSLNKQSLNKQSLNKQSLEEKKSPEILTSAGIKKAIYRSLGKASKCRNTNIKKAKSGPGLWVDHCPSYKTLDKSQKLTLTLDPSGMVSDAYFRDDAANRSEIGICILQSLKEWTFAPFSGEPVDITQKVSFEPCVPINNLCVF